MTLLIDIGNTHSHLGLANQRRVTRHADMSTEAWNSRQAERKLKQFVDKTKINSVAFCSVVPAVTKFVRRTIRTAFGLRAAELDGDSVTGIGIDYPEPKSIGPDRLANALAARHHFGAPSVVIDFGTAVTFDVVDGKGNYVGGIIAPGMAVMTDYLHEKTALLPQIKIRDTHSAIGRSTEEAMLVGAVHGYRGLIRELIKDLKAELRTKRLPVVATGGYSRLFDRNLKEITAVAPLLTLEGLRLFNEISMQGSADS